MGRPPKNKEVIREPQDLPIVGGWYVVSLRSPVVIDTATGRQTHVIDVVVAPCLSVEPHGRDFRVTFDMESTKQFSVKFPGQIFAQAVEVANVLLGLAKTLMGVK